MPKTLAEEHAAALARPVVGRYPEFAREVRRLMGYDGERPFLTARTAALKCGVNHTSVADAARGFRVREGTIYRLARGLDGDPDLLLRLARFPASRLPARAPEGEEADGEAELVAAYRGLSPRSRRLLLALAESVLDADAP